MNPRWRAFFQALCLVLVVGLLLWLFEPALHLREDTPLDPKKITELVEERIIPSTTGHELPGENFDGDTPGEPQPFYNEHPATASPAQPVTAVQIERIAEPASEYQIFAGFG